MDPTRFLKCFGAPRPGSAVTAAAIGLGAASVLASPVFAPCHGVFRAGLLSVCSKRENGGDLGAWAAHAPKGARLFASSAFGFLFATTGRDLWVMDPHYGQVVESDVKLADLFDLLCEPDVRQEFLREDLFADWLLMNPEGLKAAWLCPTPAIALAGQWTVASLQPMDPPTLLSFTAQLFDASAANGVVIRRLDAG